MAYEKDAVSQHEDVSDAVGARVQPAQHRHLLAHQRSPTVALVLGLRGSGGGGGGGGDGGDSGGGGGGGGDSGGGGGGDSGGGGSSGSENVNNFKSNIVFFPKYMIKKFRNTQMK